MLRCADGGGAVLRDSVELFRSAAIGAVTMFGTSIGRVNDGGGAAGGDRVGSGVTGVIAGAGGADAGMGTGNADRPRSRASPATSARCSLGPFGPSLRASAPSEREGSAGSTAGVCPVIGGG